MIVVTGGAGFIGSAIVWRLNELGHEDIVIVDDLKTGEKWKNINGLIYADFFHKAEFLEMVSKQKVPFNIDTIFHMGACSATTERDADYLMDNNFKYSQEMAKYCQVTKARLIYASSAATYGGGEKGYKDDEDKMEELRPLNMYGYSKQLFDIWLKNNGLLDCCAGLKFFNVYGPNEYHKGDMRSVVHKAFHQIKDTGKVTLFKSHREDYKDGEQKRDFIYVKDAVEMALFFYRNKNASGIFNIGTGRARTWNDLVTAIFNAMDKPVNIEYIDMPDYLQPKYQYFTEADNSKIREAGYDKNISSIEDGVTDYVKNYLTGKEYLAG